MKVRLKSEVIREILARKNQSQNALAMHVGTTSGYMSQLMSGARYPSPTLREKIMASLGIGEFDAIFEFVPPRVAAR